MFEERRLPRQGKNGLPLMPTKWGFAQKQCHDYVYGPLNLSIDWGEIERLCVLNPFFDRLFEYNADRKIPKSVLVIGSLEGGGLDAVVTDLLPTGQVECMADLTAFADLLRREKPNIASELEALSKLCGIDLSINDIVYFLHSFIPIGMLGALAKIGDKAIVNITVPVSDMKHQMFSVGSANYFGLNHHFWTSNGKIPTEVLTRMGEDVNQLVVEGFENMWDRFAHMQALHGRGGILRQEFVVGDWGFGQVLQVRELVPDLNMVTGWPVGLPKTGVEKLARVLGGCFQEFKYYDDGSFCQPIFGTTGGQALRLVTGGIRDDKSMLCVGENDSPVNQIGSYRKYGWLECRSGLPRVVVDGSRDAHSGVRCLLHAFEWPLSIVDQTKGAVVFLGTRERYELNGKGLLASGCPLLFLAGDGKALFLPDTEDSRAFLRDCSVEVEEVD